MPTAAEYEYLVRFSEPFTPTGWNYIGSTHGRSTNSGDTPASTYIPPSLATPPTFQLSIFDGTDPAINPRNSIGEVILRDPSGVLDTYATYVADGGIMELRRGTPGANLSTFSTVATFTTAGLAFSHDIKSFRLHNLARILEAAPLHGERYGGTGGEEGDAELAGQLKPYAVGQVWRITPVPLNASLLIYQVSATPIEEISDVSGGGNSLSASGTDHVNYAALAAATVSPDYYDTCLAEGLFRLGSTSNFALTANVKGDKTGGTYVYKRGDIAKRIVTRAGTALDPSQVNSSALSTLNAAKPDICGFFWNKEITKAAALSEVMEGCLGYWFVDLTGSLVLGSLSAPGSSPVKTYAFGDQTGIPMMTEGVRPPRWKTSLSYSRNNTIVTDRSQFPLIVTDALAAIYGRDAFWVSAETGTTFAKYPTAFEKRVYSGLWTESDAQAEATAQQTLMALPRERWDVKIYEDPFTLAGYLGQRIAISGYTRYGWSNPRTFVLVGVAWGADLIPTATLWG